MKKAKRFHKPERSVKLSIEYPVDHIKEFLSVGGYNVSDNDLNSLVGKTFNIDHSRVKQSFKLGVDPDEMLESILVALSNINLDEPVVADIHLVFNKSDSVEEISHKLADAIKSAQR